MGAYQTRIFARVAIFGFWTAMLGLTTLIVVGQSLSLLPAGSGGAVSTAGFSIGAMIGDALANLFEAGLVSMFLGTTIMFGGTWMCVKLP